MVIYYVKSHFLHPVFCLFLQQKLKMRAYCSVPDCYAPKSKYQLFHIPFNKEMSGEWRKAVGSREDEEKWHNAMVCEQHFNEEDFYVIPNSKTPGKRRLKRGAIPCINLPDKAMLAVGRREIMMENATKSLTENDSVRGVKDICK